MSWPSQQDEGGPTPQTLETSKLVLEYLRVLAWPLIIVGLIAVYRPPLGRMIDSLATKLEAANKVTIGSLSLEIQERARQLGSLELAEDLEELSPDAVAVLMRTPRDGRMILMSTNSERPDEFGAPSQNELEALGELEAKGLISFDEPLGDFMDYLESHADRLEPYETWGSDERDWYEISPSPSVDRSRIRQQGYELTERGREAVEAITQALAAELARSRD